MHAGCGLHRRNSNFTLLHVLLLVVGVDDADACHETKRLAHDHTHKVKIRYSEFCMLWNSIFGLVVVCQDVPDV